MLKYLVILILLVSCETTYSQGGWLTPNNSYGTIVNRQSIKIFSGIPTSDTIPTALPAYDLGQAGLQWVKSTHTLYVYKPETTSWAAYSGGSSGTLTDLNVVFPGLRFLNDSTLISHGFDSLWITGGHLHGRQDSLGVDKDLGALPTGTSLLLKTNSTNNGSQATLNLANGLGIIQTDNGSGTVTTKADTAYLNTLYSNNGTDTSFTGVTVDSTGQPQNRILIGIGNNHVGSYTKLITDSTKSKVVINNKNISYGGTAKLAVKGNVFADKYIVNGGTSAQFQMGDGSLNSNTYTKTIDTAAMLSHYLQKVTNPFVTMSLAADSTYILFNHYDGSKDTLRITGGTVTGGSITWPGTIYSTPTTGTLSGGTLTFAPALASQSAWNVFGRFSGSSGAPSFGQLKAENLNTTYTNAYVLQTDGSGNLSWVAQSGGVGGSWPSGNYGNIPVTRNGVGVNPASDSLGYTTSGGFTVKNKIQGNSFQSNIGGTNRDFSITNINIGDNLAGALFSGVSGTNIPGIFIASPIGLGASESPEDSLKAKFVVQQFDYNADKTNYSSYSFMHTGVNGGAIIAEAGGTKAVTDFWIDATGAGLKTTAQFTAATNGNIGIGTTTPSFGLDVTKVARFASTARFDGNFSFNGTGGTNGDIPKSTGSAMTWTTPSAIFTAGLPSLTNGSVLFSNGTTITQNNSKLFWDNTNFRLGLNTSSPASTLNVNGIVLINSTSSTLAGAGGSLIVHTGTDANIAFNNASGTARLSCFDDAASSSQPFIFNSSSTRLTVNTVEKARIESSGLLIGTTTSTNAIAASLFGSAILDFPSVSSLGVQTLTVTVTGAANGDVVDIGVPNGSMTAGLVFTSWVSASNTVSIQCYNSTLGAIDPSSGTFKARVTQ